MLSKFLLDGRGCEALKGMAEGMAVRLPQINSTRRSRFSGGSCRSSFNVGVTPEADPTSVADRALTKELLQKSPI